MARTGLEHRGKTAPSAERMCTEGSTSFSWSRDAAIEPQDGDTVKAVLDARLHPQRVLVVK
jgi:hypothetical protein